MAQATSGGASMEPTEAPMLYTPPASPRSLAGNHSAVAFMPAGLADPIPDLGVRKCFHAHGPPCLPLVAGSKPTHLFLVPQDLDLRCHDSQDAAYLTMASAALAARIQLAASPITYSCSNQRKPKSSMHSGKSGLMITYPGITPPGMNVLSARLLP